jgi:multidrug efflux pump subunit AcrB
MKLFDYGLKHRGFVFLLAFFIVIVGMLSFRAMPSRVDPYLTPRFFTVKVENKGLNVAQMMRLVGSPIERDIHGLPGIKESEALCYNTLCYYYIHLKDDIFDTQSYIQKINTVLRTAQLPPGTSRPVLNELAHARVALSVLAVNYKKTTSVKKIEKAANEIQTQLMRNSLIESVRVSGFPYRGVEIALDSHKLSSYHLTPDDIERLIKNNNQHYSLSEIDTDHYRLNLKSSGGLTDVESVKQILVKLPNSDKIIRLGDLADVSMQLLDPAPDGVAYYSSAGSNKVARAFLVRVYAKFKVNQQLAGTEITATVKRLNTILPAGMHINYSTFLPSQIKTSVSHFTWGFAFSLISIFVTLFLFINLRSALVLAITLPLIVLLGFIFMYNYGVRLERMTFAGLTIALGLIVDNSIIYILRVHRLSQSGLPIDQALKQSNSRLLKPLLIAQLTTVAAFMPALLAKNKVTEFIQSLPLTVIFMLVAASVIRFFILPQLCKFFMRAHRVGMTPDSTGGGAMVLFES